MRQTSTLLIFCCMIMSSLSAQILTGIEAEQAFPGAVKVRMDQKTQLPQHIELNAAVRMSVTEAIAYLSDHAGFGNETSFELIKQSTDRIGWEHHRYQQLVNGAPVFGGVYLFHTQDGQVKSMNGELFKIQNDNPTPTVSEEKAIEIAIAPYVGATFGWEKTLGAGKTQRLSEYPDPELVWVPVDLNYQTINFQLAYRMDVYAVHDGHHHRNWVFVDAKTGEVIAKDNQICDMDVPSQALTVYSGEREILTEQVNDDLYLLRQTTYGNGVTTLNMQNDTDTDLAIDFTHEDSEWGGEVGVFDRHALDAHFAAERYYVFLQEFFNRNSVNEEGLELICYVHYDQNLANAFWNGTASFYGDGGTGGGLNQPLTTVDIVAHEFTHGLTGFSAGLIYSYEPGALNESFSDIFGLATDFFARPDLSDWIMGDEATSDGDGIRSAEDPNSFGHPANYLGVDWWTNAGDNGGVHINSGVQNHWFYLLSEGGSGVNDMGEAFEVEGIGWEKAIAVAYRNLTTYLTPSSHFQDAAYYGSLSALELFGTCSQEYRSTVNAWHAVGLGEPIADDPIADFQSQRIFCSAPATVQFFNNNNDFQSISWDFGDGGLSTAFSPSHTYTSQGVFDVTMIVTSCGGGTQTVSKTAHIVIDNTDPICSAFVLPDSGSVTLTECSGQLLDPGGFGDYPNNANVTVIIDPPTLDPLLLNIESFDLRNGDFLRVFDGNNLNAPLLFQYTGNIANGQSIETSGGAVTLQFTSNADNNDPGFVISYSTSTAVNVPEAAFTPSNSNPGLNAPVQFTDNALFPGGYYWDFGDGATSEEANPVHQYTAPGSYSVTQVITNCLGVDSISNEINVGIGGILNLNPDSLCITLNAGDIVDTSFIVSNSGLGDLYYGAAQSIVPWMNLAAQSGEIAPSGNTTINFQLDATGLVADTFYYYIQLESGDTSQFTLEYPVKMIVLPFPQANFNLEIVDLCAGTYQFLDATINTPTDWLWSFGDGATSTDTLPIHTYTENGVYDVSLLACNDLGCDSVLQEQLIVVSTCDTLVFGETGSSMFTSCNGLLFDQGGPDENYSNNSDYTVTIAPTGADFVTLTFIQAQIQPIFDYLYVYDGLDTLSPLIIAITGSLASGATYSSTGNAVTLRFVTNEFLSFAGFNIEWSCNGNVFPPDAASFSFTQDDDCNNSFNFEGSPVGVFDYIWDFGDGNIINGGSALTYNYQSPGTYDVVLEVSNAVGSSTFEETVTVTDVPFSLDATLSADTVDINEVFTMSAVVDITADSYLWIPQVGDTLTNAGENYSYSATGDYVIYLEVTDANGCMMFVEKPIFVTNILDAEEVSLIEKFQIIPNPSNGQFILSLGFFTTKNTEIVLFNALGQIVHRESLGRINAIDKNLNFNQLAGGIYFLSIITEEGNAGVERLIIQK